MKRHLRRKSFTRKPKSAYSPQDRLRITQFFREERAKGVEAKELAKTLGVSTATLYRWQASKARLTQPAICLSPEHAIAILCDRNVTEKYKLIAAVISLSVWIRWPTEPHFHDSASAALSASYVKQKTDANIFGELDGLYRKLIENSVPIDLVWKSCTPLAFDLPIFSEYRIDGQPHTEMNVARDVVWYLLAHSAIEGRERHRPSLNKAFFLLENNAFEFHWEISKKTFQAFWGRIAPSAAFNFIEQDASSFNWLFDPASPFVSQDIDEIVEDREGTIRYLSQCLWATERLKGILHANAISSIAFPTFPKQLPPVAAEPDEMPEQMIDLLSRFRA